MSVKPGQTLHVMIRSQQQNAFPDRYSVRVYRVGDAATADSNHGVCSFWTSAAVKTGPECSMAVPVAYNDAPGQYRLVLRRDMTGVEKEFTFVIAP